MVLLQIDAKWLRISSKSGDYACMVHILGRAQRLHKIYSHWSQNIFEASCAGYHKVVASEHALERGRWNWAPRILLLASCLTPHLLRYSFIKSFMSIHIQIFPAYKTQIVASTLKWLIQNFSSLILRADCSVCPNKYIWAQNHQFLSAQKRTQKFISVIGV